MFGFHWAMLCGDAVTHSTYGINLWHHVCGHLTPIPTWMAWDISETVIDWGEIGASQLVEVKSDELFIFILLLNSLYPFTLFHNFFVPSCSRSNANERNKRLFDFWLRDQTTPVHPLQSAGLARGTWFREIAFCLIFHFIFSILSLWYLIVRRHLRQLSPTDNVP